MKKNILSIMCITALLIPFAPVSQAKADDDFYISFSSSSGGRHGGDRHGHDRGRSHHSRYYPDRDRHHDRWSSHVSYGWPSYHHRPPRTVVYERTIVQPVPQYIVAAPMPVSQVSPTYYSSYGQTCREYQTTNWVGNRQQLVYGTACLQPDGSWRTVN